MAGQIITVAEYRAKLNPDEFTKGGQSMVETSAKVTKSVDGITESTTKAGRNATLSAQGFDKFFGSIDANVGRAQQYQRDLEKLNAFQRAGAISTGQYDVALGSLNAKYNDLGHANDNAAGGLGRFGSALGQARGLLAQFGVALSVGAVVQFARGVFETTASLNEQAEQVGVNVEALQAYRAVMAESGISADEADRAIQKLTKSIGEAQAGTGTARGAFEDLGITMEVLAGGSEAVIPLVAAGLLEIESVTRRAALETEIFGKAGQKLESALRVLIDPTAELVEKQKALGLVLGEDVTTGADAASDALARFWTQIKVGTAQGFYTVFHGIAEGIKEVNDALAAAAPGDADLTEYLKTGKMPPGSKPRFPGVPNAFGAGGLPGPVRVTPGNGFYSFDRSVDVTPGAFGLGYKIADDTSEGESKYEREYRNNVASLDQRLRGKPTRPGDLIDPNAISQLYQGNSTQRAQDIADAKDTRDKIKSLWDDYYDHRAEREVQLSDVTHDAISRGIGTLSQQLAKGEVSFKSFGQTAVNVLQDILAQFIELELKSAIFGKDGSGGIFSGGGGAGGGDIFASAFKSFAGLFADGGTVGPGQWGIAGEHGPEPIFGGMTGATVFPHGSGGGSSVTIINNIDARGAAPGVEENIARLIDQRISAAAPHIIDGSVRTVSSKMRNKGLPTIA